MRKFILYTLLLFVALNAFGHAGEVHNYMGTITAVHDDGSFMLKKTDGKTIHVAVAETTAFVYSDGKTATRAGIAVGTRVVVTISKDGKTAAKIKFAAPKKTAK